MCIYKFSLQFHKELIHNIDFYNSLVSEQQFTNAHTNAYTDLSTCKLIASMPIFSGFFFSYLCLEPVYIN